MSAESDLYSILAGSAGVTALVSTRIYPDALPEDAIYPAIAFVRSTSDPVYAISNHYYGEDAELSIGCWGKTRTSADQVAEAVILALQAAGHAHSARSGGYDPDTGLFATTLDVRIFDLP